MSYQPKTSLVSAHDNSADLSLKDSASNASPSPTSSVGIDSADKAQDYIQSVAQKILSGSSTQDPPALPVSQRDVYVKALGESVVLHVQRLVEDSIEEMIDKRAYFRERDVCKTALRKAQRRVDEKTLEKKEFVDCVEWVVSRRPLVSIGTTGYLTTQEMWDMENLMLDLANEKNDIYIQPQDVFDRAIARKKGISEEQTAATAAAALSPNRITVIEGSAGAGKSFTMEAVKEIYQEMGYEVMGTALGWSAAKVLGDSAKIEDDKCVAIAGLTEGWLRARAHGVDPFTKPTLLIVDEAGMVGTRHMSIILEETRRSKFPVKVVLTGDSLQVIPVNAGAALETIIAWHGTVRINTIRRQFQPSHRKAVYRFSQKHSGPALHTFLQQECFRWCKDKDMLLNRVAQDYISYRVANPNKKALVLALANKDVLELNFRIRAAFRKLGLIGQEDILLKVNNGVESFEAQFSVGDEVLLRANDKNMMVYEIDPKKSPLRPDTWKPKRLGVFNRNAGRIVGIRRSRDPLGSYDLTIDLGGDVPGRVVVNTETFGKTAHSEVPGLPLIHNYAGTVYGSQGQTVSHVFLIDSPRMDFRLAYVGMSRHKEGVEVYLDETDLHRRLDQVSQKRQSMEHRLQMKAQGKSMDDAVVTLGRYTRQEMLRAVALTWGKHSENLTAVMMENMRRRPKNILAKEAENQAKVEPASLKETIIDFIPEYNRSYPTVDVEKILALPDPLVESELVRPSDVEENRKKYVASLLPLDVDATPLPQPSRKVETRRDHVAQLPRSTQETEKGFFHHAVMSLKERFKHKPEATEEKATPVELPKGPLRQQDASNPFADVEGIDPSVKVEGEEELTESVLERLNRWLNPKPQVDIPYRAESSLCGRVIYPPSDPDFEKDCREKEIPDPRPHFISFEGVPVVANVEGGPDSEWVSSKRFDMWDVGRHGEPRILAKSAQGHVVARYRFNGECVVGEGFPPVCVNRHGTSETPVYIVAGPKEWFWLRQTMEEKFKDTPEKIPHCIWAAKDVDWGLFAGALRRSQKVVIVRSKMDDRQTQWACDLQHILNHRFKVSSMVSPALPEGATPTEGLGTRASPPVIEIQAMPTSPSPSSSPPKI